MTHSLNRLEKTYNEDNSIKEIFLSVKLFSDSNEFVWEQGYWLNKDEINMVMGNEQSVSTIVVMVASIGEEAYWIFIANAPIEENKNN
jgi:hypothetical protein